MVEYTVFTLFGYIWVSYMLYRNYNSYYAYTLIDVVKDQILKHIATASKSER